jgi:hypothetical protein
MNKKHRLSWAGFGWFPWIFPILRFKPDQTQRKLLADEANECVDNNVAGCGQIFDHMLINIAQKQEVVNFSG